MCKPTVINTFPSPARPLPQYAASEFLKFLFHVCWLRLGGPGGAALQPQSRRGGLRGSTQQQPAHCEHQDQHEQLGHSEIEQQRPDQSRCEPRTHGDSGQCEAAQLPVIRRISSPQPHSSRVQLRGAAQRTDTTPAPEVGVLTITTTKVSLQIIAVL